MAFNHYPANTLCTELQQRLEQLESYPLQLTNNLICNLSELHRDYVKNVILSEKEPTKITPDYIANKKKNLEHYRDVLAELNTCFQAIDGDSTVYTNELNERINVLDEKVQSLTHQNAVPVLGEYNGADKTVTLFINNIKSVDQTDWENILAFTYVEQMMHAFFDSVAQCNGSHYLEEIEAPIAVLGMLQYLKNASEKGNQDANTLLTVAENNVRAMKSVLPHYAYGAYLYSVHEYTDKNGNPKGVQINDILGDYAVKASRLDKDSADVIELYVSLTGSYPCSEHEGLLFSLLTSSILNVGQTQVMKFTNIFENSKTKLKEALWERWSNKNSKFDDTYKGQIEAILDNGFSENILVENMSPWKSSTPKFRGGDDWDKIVPNLWKKPFPPYKHQVEAWNALLSTKQAPYSSMVVTTGTGSGKTECFMAPLIADLASLQDTGVQAIFLYPLNALMEDQKERLNDMIEASGTDIKFAVYNGMSPSEKDKNFNPSNLKDRYNHELVYREEIRGEKTYDVQNNKLINGCRFPNIILTNPTMLEYMLLRKDDQKIIRNSQNKLRWIVIDETHTFTGAGADEIAMLIKRLLLAFDETVDDVRFTTSSATIGKTNDNTHILKFISGITGQPNQTVISGSRSIPSFSLAITPTRNDKCSISAKLAMDNYVPLKELIPYKHTTKERLEELDRLAEGGLKVKVHFYEQALTNGLFVDLKDIAKGQFQLRTDIPLTQDCALDPDVVRAVYCKDCGEVMANCMIEDGTDKYIRDTSLQTDEYGNAEAATGRYIAINRQQNNCKNTIKIDIDSPNQKKIAGNSGLLSPLDKGVSVCPCCGGKNVYPFNVSSMTTNKAIAPVLLDNANPDKDPDSKPYEGRQFISFADSRSSAAKPSMKQNLDTEEQWVISVIKNKLEELKGDLYQQVLNAISVLLPTDPISVGQDFTSLQNAKVNNNIAEIQKLALKYNVGNPIISWDKALDELYQDSYSERLAQCFAKKDDYEIVNGHAKLKDEFKRKYVLGALYNVMQTPDRHSFTAEGYGLFRVVYIKLDRITSIPQSINDLIRVFNLNQGTISLNDWKCFLKIFLDHIRIDQDLYYEADKQYPDWKDYDIESCRNLKITNGKRRTIKKQVFGDSRMCKLLFTFLGFDNRETLVNQYPQAESWIQNVLDSMMKDLRTVGLIRVGRTYDKNYGWNDDCGKVPSDRTNERLNLSDISFALYDDDTYNIDDVSKIIVDTPFKGFSPWRDPASMKYNVRTRNIASYTEWPTSASNVKVWLASNKIGYLFCDKLAKVYDNAKLFVQLEHTAQVSREISRNRIEQFKNHEINILSCSTTMEMGVDIGELELVAMSNIPPHPANYKQRAGRAGRAAQSKSACITVCNSDAVGLSVIEDPKTNLLEREVVVPTASLKSPQILKRHFNSYLLREFYSASGIRNLKSETLIDFFFDRNFVESKLANSNVTVIRNVGIQPSIEVWPNEVDRNSNHLKNSACFEFKNWLNGFNIQTNLMQWDGLEKLKKGTLFERHNVISIVQETIQALDRLKVEFENNLFDICNASQVVQNWDSSLPKNSLERKFNFDFTSFLCQSLIQYCSTHQFTPNANMPVNIVALRTSSQDSFDEPSRDLKTALSEYAPGNMVIIDGKSYKVAGVDWNHEAAYTDIHICMCGHAWKNGNNVCPFCGKSGRDVRHYRMIEPTTFITEHDTSRIIWNDNTRNVQAKLLGGSTFSPGGLYEVVSSSSDLTQTSSILYYNAGKQYGYAICKEHDPRCGRTVLDVNFKQQSSDIRDILYPEKKTLHNGTIAFYHKNLTDGKEELFNPSKVERNMIFGGEVQTDFVEFKPYRKNGLNKRPLYNSEDEDKSVLLTLGIMFADYLAAQVPCQRQDIDFLVNTYQNNELALCMYDTAKGGAGYSINLGVSIPWDKMLDSCRLKLENILNGYLGISSLLSRATMKYLERINVKATYEWLCEEYISRDPLPQSIKAKFPTAVESSYANLKNAYKASLGNALLFVQGTIDKWNYDLDIDTIPNWKDMKALDFPSNGNNIPLVLSCNPGTIPAEMVSTIYKIQNWANLNILANGEPTGVYFLAYINGYLYVSDDEQYAQLDGNWGNGNIYSVQVSQPQIQNLNPVMAAVEDVYIPASQNIMTTDLFDVVCRLDTQNVIMDFLNNARNHRLQFEYLDEHLKTHLGMCITIQFIKKMIDVAQCTNYSIKFVNEVYDQSTSRNACRKDDPYRRIYSILMNNNERDDLLAELASQLTNNISIDSLNKGASPHYRCLTITDLDTNQRLRIKPHGGFATDWDFDTVKAHGTLYYPNRTGVNTPIPICSKAYKILYTISNN